MEPQTLLSNLPRVGAEPADQAEKADCSGEKPEPLAVPESINQCWSMDFMP